MRSTYKIVIHVQLLLVPLHQNRNVQLSNANVIICSVLLGTFAEFEGQTVIVSAHNSKWLLESVCPLLYKGAPDETCFAPLHKQVPILHQTKPT